MADWKTQNTRANYMGKLSAQTIMLREVGVSISELEKKVNHHHTL